METIGRVCRGRRVGLVVCGVLWACSAAAAGQSLSFELADVQGRQVRAQDYKGRPIFLEFGACW